MKRRSFHYLDLLPFIFGLLVAIGFALVFSHLYASWPRRCVYSGCNNYAEEDSVFCWTHENLTKPKTGKPSYLCAVNGCAESAASGSVYCRLHGGSSSKSGFSSSSSGKSFSSHGSAYDEGYEAVYDGGDYDTDCYRTDREYAAGVDEAPEDEDE